jgi:hypothetical protein
VRDRPHPCRPRREVRGSRSGRDGHRRRCLIASSRSHHIPMSPSGCRSAAAASCEHQAHERGSHEERNANPKSLA